MLGQIPRPFASNALVATLLILAVGVTAPPTIARADDCLTTPNSVAPQGSHWYYHLDRATERKCWYVRAPGQPAQQAATTTGPAAPLHSTPAPSGKPSPQFQTSAVKLTPAPVRGGTADKTAQHSSQEENSASTPVVPAPQTSTLLETSPKAATPPAVTWPDAAVALAAVKAQEPIAVPTDARSDPVSGDAEGTTRRAEPARNGGMLMIIFPVLALGLAGVGILSRVAIKNTAARRAQITVNHPKPEPHKVDDQRQHEWPGNQHPHRSVVKEQELHSLVLAVSDPGPLRNDNGAFQIAQERRDRLVQFCRDIERMLQSPASPHEEPLRGRAAA